MDMVAVKKTQINIILIKRTKIMEKKHDIILTIYKNLNC